MNEASCFGKLFDDNATECSAASCDAREECRKNMLNVEGRILRCMGDFDPNNRACTDACTKNKECKDLKEGKKPDISSSTSASWNNADSAVKPSFKVKVESIITEPIDHSEYKPKSDIKKADISVVEKIIVDEPELTEKELDEIHGIGLPTGTTAGPSSMSNLGTTKSVPSPKTEPKEPKTGKISKKSVVRDNIRLLKRFKSDDLVQAIIDAGLGDDTPEDMKKNRNLVQMWISEFNREKVFVITKDGAFYVLN
jgi:hypothetical protein